ncbi:hypothetical protein E4U21_002545 [Claviceps maximensis]|nr:hypothetical protein E4U21_002545 [Claviceps maximensis]
MEEQHRARASNARSDASDASTPPTERPTLSPASLSGPARQAVSISGPTGSADVAGTADATNTAPSSPAAASQPFASAAAPSERPVAPRTKQETKREAKRETKQETEQETKQDDMVSDEAGASSNGQRSPSM